MKEFIEKLVSRLEELIDRYEKQSLAYNDINKIYEFVGREQTAGLILEIVNELAEEYSANTPQKSAGGWIPVTERLPKYDAESEYYEEVIVTLNNGIVTTGYYRNLDEEWWVQGRSMKCLKNSVYSVVAWQPFPKSYIPRGQWKDAVMNHFTKIE